MKRFSPAALRRARVDSGIRIECVAVAISRSVDSIRAYESGRANPPAAVVASLAAALGIDPGDLFTPDDLDGAA